MVVDEKERRIKKARKEKAFHYHQYLREVFC